MQNKVNQRIDRKTDEAIDKELDKIEGRTKEETTTAKKQIQMMQVKKPPRARPKPTYKAYQNYDFIAGDTILFQDHFGDDEDGNFPRTGNWRKGRAL